MKELEEAQKAMRGATINDKVIDEYSQTGVVVKYFDGPADVLAVNLRPHLYTESGSKIKKYRDKTIFYRGDGVLTAAWISQASTGITARHLPVEVGETLDQQGIQFKKTLPYRMRRFTRNIVKRIIS